MRIGFVGVGKLGLPVAVACDFKGHDVVCYDIDLKLMSKTPRRYIETGPEGTGVFDDFLLRSNIKFGSLPEIAEHSEIIFVAVQTPHKIQYEGVTRLPHKREDFDYTFLQEAIHSLSKVIERETVIAVISTVLPGTIREKVLPLINPYMKICYNPSFIAMGTTMYDFLYPEFVLIGERLGSPVPFIHQFYYSITDAPIIPMSIENAELTKVAYNTFIGMKIVFANTLMEICHKTPGTNVDVVTDALKQAHRRLISSSYLSGGMGDGGGCHPRDNIALSYLSRKLNLSYDLFGEIMKAREAQAEWLADLMCYYNLPKVILGYTFKPETNITTGSPAVLVQKILQERRIFPLMVDPYVDVPGFVGPAVFLIGTKHLQFRNMKFPKGSVVLDPWRWVNFNQTDATYIPIGVGLKDEHLVVDPNLLHT